MCSRFFLLMCFGQSHIALDMPSRQDYIPSPRLYLAGPRPVVHWTNYPVISDRPAVSRCWRVVERVVPRRFDTRARHFIGSERRKTSHQNTVSRGETD